MKKTILTMLLALVALMGQAIDERHFHSGTAVLKGRILNRPAGEEKTLSVHTYNHFTDEVRIVNMPVADDGRFEHVIPLDHSQSVRIVEMGDFLLLVGDTLEVTIDAAKEKFDRLTFLGHNTSATINQLWPALRAHYFGHKSLIIPSDQLATWKPELVEYIDRIIADIQADRLPLPAGTDPFVKEVLGASLLAEPFVAFGNYCHDNLYTKGTRVMGSLYDFLAGREQWLLDYPAMLFAVQDGHHVVNRVVMHMMPDYNFLKPSRVPGLRPDDQTGLYQAASRYIQERYHLKSTNLMQQIALCWSVFREDHIDEDSSPDELARLFSAAIPQITNPIVAKMALQRYRQYVISREGQPVQTASMTPEADAIFNRIIAPYKGNVLKVDFWGIYCSPCKADILAERERVESQKDLPVRYLYICDQKDSPRDRTEKWLQDNNVKGEHIYVTHEEWKLLSEKFQFNAPPFNTAVDENGTIITLNAFFNRVVELMQKQGYPNGFVDFFYNIDTAGKLVEP